MFLVTKKAKKNEFECFSASQWRVYWSLNLPWRQKLKKDFALGFFNGRQFLPEG